VEREGDMLDCGCDYKTKTGMTYQLEVGKEGDMSDYLQNKGKDDIQSGDGESNASDGTDNKMRVGTTYSLEVEREGNISDCSCDYKTRVGTTYRLKVEGVTFQVAGKTTK
jgi:hypothetical protein